MECFPRLPEGYARPFQNSESKRGPNVADKKKKETDTPTKDEETAAQDYPTKVKFEVWGEEMIEKRVKLSGNSGRVYLPPTWVGHHVKIIRID
jgi:putative transposon-encoded protein